MKLLNLGCGDRGKIRDDDEWEEVGVDIKQPCDVLHDLNIHPLPFKDEEFDEIHAYHILEHLSSQGDWRFFFSEFSEYYRILKPFGIMKAIVPAISGAWAWGDPGHTRVFSPNLLVFLDQEKYSDQVGRTAMAEYRHVWKGHFKLITYKNIELDFFQFVIQKTEYKGE